MCTLNIALAEHKIRNWVLLQLNLRSHITGKCFRYILLATIQLNHMDCSSFFRRSIKKCCFVDEQLVQGGTTQQKCSRIFWEYSYFLIKNCNFIGVMLQSLRAALNIKGLPHHKQLITVITRVTFKEASKINFII